MSRSIVRVTSREYKLMLDQRMFADRKSAAEEFCRELRGCAMRLNAIEVGGGFAKTKKREIVFLDTRDLSINLNGLLFRQRVELKKKVAEYTLKCRSPDRYFAAGADLRAAMGIEDRLKLEEDIAPPFVARFSHSNTISATKQTPANLQEAAKLFPALGKLERDGVLCSQDIEILPVNSLTAFERVLTGAFVKFGGTVAEMALILWSDGRAGRPLVAEFSFRYGRKKENYSQETVRLAMQFFLAIQRLDWCLPAGQTKTQYAYRAA